MAVLDKEELKKKLIEHFSTLEDDSAISMIEDISDSFESFGGDDTSEWKTKYEEIKKKYVDRFLNKEEKPEEKTDDEEEVEETETEDEGEVTEEDIFKVKEEN